MPSPLDPETSKHLARLMNPLVEKMARFAEAQASAITESLAPLQEVAARLVADALRGIDFSALTEGLKRALPPNWDLASAEETLELVRETGWCLVWCPRASVIAELLQASGTEERTTVLLNSRDDVIEDLRTRLDEVDHAALADNRRAAHRAVDAFADEHFEAAQSLAGSGISALINGTFRSTFRKAKKNFTQDDIMEEPIWTLRESLVLDMVARGLQTFYAERGDPVPGEFSRHATAHTISPQQYTEANALAALLLLVAFVKETQLLLEEDATAGSSHPPP